MKVAYLGPEGSYSHITAHNFYQHSELIACETIDDIFDMLENNNQIIGIVPVENSIEGSVSTTLDLLLQRDVFVKQEIVTRINHYFCVREKKNIETIASHPQALSQCHGYLRQNYKNARIIPTQSTSQAAKMLSENLVDAAICSIEAAKIHNLIIIDGPINNNNHTRFFVISTDNNFVKGEVNKTSIIFSTFDKPGSLYKILAIFNLWDINLTKIESRPSKKELGQYVFFVDIEGFVDNPDIADALKIIQRKTTFFKLIGSYPVLK